MQGMVVWFQTDSGRTIAGLFQHEQAGWIWLVVVSGPSDWMGRSIPFPKHNFTSFVAKSLAWSIPHGTHPQH